MPATGHRIGRLKFAPLAILAFGLRADSALDVHALFENAAAALTNHQPAAFAEMFDSSMPGASKIKRDADALSKISDTVSTIEWRGNEGNDESRTVQLDWLLEITERGGAAAVTRRRAEVQCRLAKKSGHWKIVSFAPADFFAAPQGNEAWMLVSSAAEGLTEAVGDSATFGGNRPAANARKFLEAFDSGTPGYSELRDNVLALEQRGDIESSVDLLSNEGDDRARTIQLDWTMSLAEHDTGIPVINRNQTVTIRVEKKAKGWRITSIEPLSFFAPPGAGKTPLY